MIFSFDGAMHHVECMVASPEPYVVQGEAVRVERVARVCFCKDGFKLIQRDDRMFQEPGAYSTSKKHDFSNPSILYWFPVTS